MTKEEKRIPKMELIRAIGSALVSSNHAILSMKIKGVGYWGQVIDRNSDIKHLLSKCDDKMQQNRDSKNYLEEYRIKEL